MKITDNIFQYQPDYIVVSKSVYDLIKKRLRDYFPSNIQVIVNSDISSDRGAKSSDVASQKNTRAKV